MRGVDVPTMLYGMPYPPALLKSGCSPAVRPIAATSVSLLAATGRPSTRRFQTLLAGRTGHADTEGGGPTVGGAIGGIGVALGLGFTVGVTVGFEVGPAVVAVGATGGTAIALGLGVTGGVASTDEPGCVLAAVGHPLGVARTATPSSAGPRVPPGVEIGAQATTRRAIDANFCSVRRDAAGFPEITPFRLRPHLAAAESTVGPVRVRTALGVRWSGASLGRRAWVIPTSATPA